MKISAKDNLTITTWEHIIVDPFLAMVCFGAVGHMHHWPVLYSFSYIEVFLINLGLQFIFPVISDPKILPSKDKVEL